MATARRPWCSCRPGASSTRASTRRSCPISASASAASPIDGRGNGKSDRPADVAAYSLDNYLADALAVMDATDAGRRSWSAFRLAACIACILAAHHPERVKAAILAGTVGDHRTPAIRYIDAAAFHGQARAGSRAGTSTTATTGWRTIPISPSTSSATSSPSRIRPSRSRTASNGPARPRARCWSRPWRRAASCRRSTSARRCTARSAVPC